jgi:Tol biopolymer transport system component
MIQNLQWALALLVVFMFVACEDSNQSTNNSNNNPPVVTDKIYYLAGYPGDLYVVNVDGTGNIPLTFDAENGNLDVSLDGSKIIYANSAGDNWNLYIADVSNGTLKNKTVLYDSPYRDEDCKFSKDASRVVFKTNKFGIEQHDSRNVYDICTLDIASGVVTQLTSNSDAEAWAPVFSPDGNKIAFVLRPNGSGAAGDEIYMIDSDGNNLKRITNNSYADWYPSFSTDGNLIYVSAKVDSCSDDLYQIAATDLAVDDPGSLASLLTVNECSSISDADPCASRENENTLAFASTRKGGYGIYFGDKSTGKVSTVITKDGVDLLGPVLFQKKP